MVYDIANISLQFYRKMIHHLYDAQKNKQIAEYLEIIDNATESTIEKMIQFFFAMDVSRDLADITEPVVIFLDSYEKISNVSMMDNTVTDWLMGEDGLFKNIPNTIWVVFGTEPLNCDDNSINLINAPELTSFNETYSKEYLNKVGIKDVRVQSDFIKSSKGMPDLLSLLVLEYQMKRKSGIAFRYEDMESKAGDWIKRLLNIFSPSEKEYIYVLSTLLWWDDDIVSNIYPEYKFNRYDNCVEKLLMLGFIENDEERYYFKKTFSDILKNYSNKEYLRIKETTAQNAIKYYKSAIDEGEMAETLLGEYLFEIIRQYTNIDISIEKLTSEYFHYISPQIRKMIESGRLSEVVRIFEFINGKITHFIDDETELSTLVLIDYSMMKRYRGDLAEAKIHVNKALEYLKQEFNDDHIYVINAYQELSSIFYFDGDYKNAISVDEHLLKIKTNTLGETDISTLWTSFYLATSYNQIGKQEEAKNILEDTMHKLDDIYPKTEKLIKNRVMHHLAIVYEGMGNDDDKKKALDIKLSLRDVRVADLGINHPYTLKMQYSIVRTYLSLKKYDEAISLCKKTIKGQESIFGSKHPDVLKSKRQLACCMREQGDIVMAINLLDEIEKDFIDTIGNYARETLNTVYEKIITIQRNVDCTEQSVELAKDALKIAKENGYDDSDEIIIRFERICKVVEKN